MYKDIIKEHYLYSEPKKVYLTNIEKDKTYTIESVPQQFSPVIAYNDNNSLRRVYFRKEVNGDLKFSLRNHEKLQVKVDKSIYLSYTNVKDLVITYNSNNISFSEVKDNKVLLNVGDELIEENLEVSYVLKDSFILEIEDRQSYITFSEDYSNMNVVFESNKISPFYMAKEVNLNPYKNDLGEGFVFVSDENEKFKEFEVYVSPKKLLARKGQIANVKVKLIDLNNNPIYPSEPVEVTSLNGNIRYYTGTSSLVSGIQSTDLYGNVYAIYEVSNEESLHDVITVKYKDNVETFEIKMFKNEYEDNFYFLLVKSNKEFIFTKEIAKIKAVVLDREANPVSDISVNFKSEYENKTISTDLDGAAIYEFKAPKKINSVYKDVPFNISASVDGFVLNDFLKVRIFNGI